MLQKNTFNFLEDLKNNNSSEWFNENREDYDVVREDVEGFVMQIIQGLSIIDKSIQLQYLNPKKCIKRIFRDVRFSLDKTPYKTNFFVIFNPGGHKSDAASYYLHIEPNKSFVGGGVYMPSTLTLNIFRKEIEYGLAEWEEIVNRPSFLKLFPNKVQASSILKTVPRGFDIDSEAIHYLRMKGYYTSHSLGDNELTSTDALPLILNAFKEVQPMIKFLNEAL